MGEATENFNTFTTAVRGAQEQGGLGFDRLRLGHFFCLGGAAPQTPRILAGGPKPPQTPPLNGRPQHLIEAAKRGRLDQMLLFSAPLDRP